MRYWCTWLRELLSNSAPCLLSSSSSLHIHGHRQTQTHTHTVAVKQLVELTYMYTLKHTWHSERSRSDFSGWTDGCY